MLIKLRPKSIATAYHCLACGAPCRPDDLYCSYCKQRYDRRFTDSVSVSSSRARLLVKSKSDYVYFPLLEITEHNFERPVIDTTISEGGHYRRYIPGIKDPGDDIKVVVLMTDDMRRKLANMQQDIETTYKVEIDGFSNAFGFSGYTSHISRELYFDIGSQSEIHVVPTGFAGWKPMPTEPTDLTCPNCGAPIKSRFGCCDYCTGWVEWVDDIA